MAHLLNWMFRLWVLLPVIAYVVFLTSGTGYQYGKSDWSLSCCELSALNMREMHKVLTVVCVNVAHVPQILNNKKISNLALRCKCCPSRQRSVSARSWDRWRPSWGRCRCRGWRSARSLKPSTWRIWVWFPAYLLDRSREEPKPGLLLNGFIAMSSVLPG